MKKILPLLIILVAFMATELFAQENPEGPLLEDKENMLLTVFLKHDQSMNNIQRRELLDKFNFRDTFPPAGVEIVDHYVMMGIGQVLVLKFTPDRLRAVNVAIERSGWGAYQTEFYVTYDIREARRYQEQQAQEAAK